MTERDFQSSVLALAQLHGWRTAHFASTVKIVRRGGKYTPVPDRGAAGFPDLVLVKGSRLIFAELKTDAKASKLSEDQEAWIADLRGVAEHLPAYANPVEVYLWRPKDWPKVVETLSRGSEVAA